VPQKTLQKVLQKILMKILQIKKVDSVNFSV
jgi:hypothetical protein